MSDATPLNTAQRLDQISKDFESLTGDLTRLWKETRSPLAKAWAYSLNQRLLANKEELDALRISSHDDPLCQQPIPPIR